MSHATIAGIAVLIEKSFQPGHEKLASQGIEVYALAQITEMAENYIKFKD